MKVKFETVDSFPSGFTTVGYWKFSEPNNHGTLTVQVMRMSDWRYSLAVWGHELIEVFYCWFFGITTEAADKFDLMYEEGYKTGKYQLTQEPGHDPACPYHWGHMAGVCWEHISIRLTLASFEKYETECLRLMGITTL